jgi:uncharacterized protein
MAARVASLDALRGLAVLFMLEVHLGFWWARGLPEDNALVVAGTALGGMAAPVFLVLAGAGLSLSRKREPEHFVRRSELRGAALLLAGIVFTFVEQAVYGPLGWGVLQCIGLSIILCAPLMRLSRQARVILGIGIMGAAAFLRPMLGVPDILYSDQLMAVGTVADYLRGMLVSGFFPLLPWLGFLVLGTVAGDRVADGDDRNVKLTVLDIATPLVIILAGALLTAYGIRPEFFPASLSFSLLACGIVLFAIPVLMAMDLGRARPLADLGRISLSVFIAHHLIGYGLFGALGLLHSFDLAPALALVLASWALALAAARAWARADFRWSLEWAISRLSGAASK